VIGLALNSSGDKEISIREENIKLIVVCAVFALLGGVYLFNATNSETAHDIPTDLLVAAASLIVGYYFRGKR
jgi:hypothetical protein